MQLSLLKKKILSSVTICIKLEDMLSETVQQNKTNAAQFQCHVDAKKQNSKNREKNIGHQSMSGKRMWKYYPELPNVYESGQEGRKEGRTK